MGFASLDYIIVAVYLLGVTCFGVLAGGKQSSTKDYFLGGKTLPWWAVGFSIVASETSTLTFISVPGLAYASNLHFLQLIFGYFVGRLLVSVFFIPAYYAGNLETAYDFLGKRFGLSLRKFTSSVFIVTRVLASGVRLFATAIPIHLITGWNYPTSILVIGVFTLMYTYVGGLRAVVAMDVVQLFVYLSGAAISMAIILHHLPNGWTDVLHYASLTGDNKLEIFNRQSGKSFFDFLTAPYTFVGSLLGGTFLTMASHGTDQLLVQRLLGCKARWDSQRALMLDAALIVLQFLFFLVLGLCLYAYYGGVSFQQLGLRSYDEIFPKFIVESLPAGVSGLLIASVLASAMGSLSSSISALASSSFLDVFRLTAKGRTLDSKKEMLWSRILTLVWGLLLIGGAMLFTDTHSSVVEVGLKIASVTYGGLLGTFFLGLFFKSTNQVDAFVGLLAGLVTMVAVLSLTNIDYTWHTMIGCMATIIAGNLRFWILKFRLRK